MVKIDPAEMIPLVVTVKLLLLLLATVELLTTPSILKGLLLMDSSVAATGN